MYVEDYISIDVIKKWLRAYPDMLAGGNRGESTGSGGEKPSDGISGTQINRIMLEDAIEELGEFNKKVCLLYYRDGYTQHQIAAMLDVSRSTVVRRIERIHKDIYAILNKELRFEKDIDKNYHGLLKKILG